MATVVLVQDAGFCPMCGAMSGWWMVVAGVFWLAAVALLVFGVIWFARQRGRLGGDRSGRILRERYARGDIDRETFERMRRELEA